VIVVLVVGAFAGSALAQWWASPAGVDLPVRASSQTEPMERIRVEVLNGGGRSGMARAATGQLRDDGFDVVYFGNAEGRDSSAVLSRTEDLETARLVADALGIRTVLAEPDSNLYLDVTVVLGEEWEPRPDLEAETNVEATPWWDLRRFLPKRPAPDQAGNERLVDPATDDGGR
jgi:hypothetical protein